MSLKKLWHRAVNRAYDDSYELARVGKHNPDASTTLAVVGLADYLWVTLADQTTVQARNDAGVPQTIDLEVWVRAETNAGGGAPTYVIEGRSAAGLLSAPTTTPPSGVLAHATTHQHGGTDEIATATPAANAIPKADGSGLLNAWVTPPPVTSVNTQTGAVVLDADDIDDAATTNKFATAAELSKLAGIEAGADVTDAGNVGSSIDGTADLGAPVDTDKLAAVRGGSLGTILISALKTAFNAIYGRLASANTWTQVNTFSSRVDAPIVRANSASGLRLEDDAGNLILFGQDATGYVGIGNLTTPVGFEVVIPVTQTAQSRDAVRIGILSSTPRVVFENATAGQIWMLDVHTGGNFRFFQPGVVALTLTPTGQLIAGGLSAAGAQWLATQAGTSGNDAAVGGLLYTTTTNVGNVGTGDDQLAAYTIPANTLSVNNQCLIMEAFGYAANNANAKTLSAWLGGASVASNALQPNREVRWHMRFRVFRTGATTYKYSYVVLTDYVGGPTHITSGTGTLTWSNSNALQVVGNATSTDDIVCQAMTVDWCDANS